MSAAFLNENGQALFFAIDSPIIGNKAGTVTVVDFFDYQCSYCKHFSPLFTQLTAAKTKLRVVFKELPIFGQESEMASMAALAAYKQGKYLKLHEAFMAVTELTPENIEQLSMTEGITKQMLADYEVKNKRELARNFALSDKLHLVGTPSFVIASITPEQLKQKQIHNINAYYVAGAADVAEMQELISQFLQKC